jgi:DNA-directed RNA polymerase specialized sigma24 family protein
MKRLSSDEREVIVQHLYGELTFQQISQIRGHPLGTVVSWYRRGLDKLRRELETVNGSI